MGGVQVVEMRDAIGRTRLIDGIGVKKFQTRGGGGHFYSEGVVYVRLQRPFFSVCSHPGSHL